MKRTLKVARGGGLQLAQIVQLLYLNHSLQVLLLYFFGSVPQAHNVPIPLLGLESVEMMEIFITM